MDKGISKQMVLIGLVVQLVSCCFLAAEVSVQKIPAEGFKKTQIFPITTQSGFALVNTTKRPIWVTLENNGKVIVSSYKVLPQRNSSFEGFMTFITISKPTKLTIKTGMLFGKYFGKKKKYTFTPGKTIYVVWEKGNKLRPQVGEFFGLVPHSKVGFALKNNVQPRDITKH